MMRFMKRRSTGQKNIYEKQHHPRLYVGDAAMTMADFILAVSEHAT